VLPEEADAIVAGYPLPGWTVLHRDGRKGRVEAITVADGLFADGSFHYTAIVEVVWSGYGNSTHFWPSEALTAVFK
jgi:hypothetical protein